MKIIDDVKVYIFLLNKFKTGNISKTHTTPSNLLAIITDWEHNPRANNDTIIAQTNEHVILSSNLQIEFD